jgi:DHA1 family bicyclomycin/chloramphenicol resistance-like MFS transporter
MQQTFAKNMILVTVILMDILGGAEIDLFVPSFPEIQSQFQLSPILVEALLSVNFAGFCISLIFVGALADKYGRKPIILLGITTFIIGSMLCLVVASYEFLLVGRFLQGLGIAAPATLCFLIIADIYPIKKQQYLMAMLNGLVNTSVGVAPVIGSYLTMYFHWQGNFMALLLLAVVVLIMTIIFIPSHNSIEHKERTSLEGYFSIFKSKSILLLIASFVFMCVPYWVFIGMSPLLYIKDLGVSLSHFGYYQGAMALVFAFGSLLAGLIINKYEQKRMLYVSYQICIIALILMLIITFMNSSNPLVITVALIPYTIGSIIPVTIIYPICLNYMPHAKGRISVTITGIRLILTAFGLELASYYYVGSFQNIGIIISSFFFVAVATLYFVTKNREVTKIAER